MARELAQPFRNTTMHGTGRVSALDESRAWIDLLDPLSGRLWLDPRVSWKSDTPITLGLIVAFVQHADTITSARPIGNLVKTVEPVSAECP